MFRRLLVFALLAFSAAQLPACAQNPPPAATATAAAAAATAARPLAWLDTLLTASKVMQQHQVGICLADAATGEILFGQNEAKYFTPASTMKLLSFYTGLHLLGDSLPSLRYLSRNDTLFFQGTGDPTLLHGDVPSRRAVEFLRTRPEKILAYCDRPTSAPYGPSWTWDDYNYYFQPERGAFPIYGHTVRFYAAAGQAPRVLPRQFRPLVSAAATRPTDPDDHVRRELEDNRFAYYRSPKKWIDETPFRPSRSLLLRLLGDTLRRAVVGVGRVSRATEAAMRTLPGLPADSLYRRMLRVSDNFLAEQLLLMCASRLPPLAAPDDSLSTERVIRFARRNYLGFAPDPVRWADGSGLSRLNLVTPRTLLAVLLKLHQEVPEKRLLSLLAPGGGQGTLRKRYFDPARSAAKGVPAMPKQTWLWGKTGTLSNNHNLCGYLRTKSGRLVAVVFMNNNFPTDDYPLRNEMERLLGQVRERL
ncbi:D-alanyl-D-alanine carboxypeptidase [uncultured Hymenobacter sp.]|uniref:D-alanyl-D-alanine carboxypeptidase n=1 Tax=uncultured Hymenobacter sp. TaxID=170016 RepID=UPI0035CC2BA8